MLARPLRILEMGVWRGGSLDLWRQYFGPDAIIYGIDIDEVITTLGIDSAEVRVGSQTDEIFLLSVIEEMGGLDIVIDDGSHQSKDVLASLRILFPRLAEGGTYVIEDLHTSYWPAWGPRPQAQGEFDRVPEEPNRWTSSALLRAFQAARQYRNQPGLPAQHPVL
jgi:cephalosporin hydroxylase